MKMQIKEIKYNGFTETPSDYECPDGDLATVSGLVPEDEGLRPVMKPDKLFSLPSGGYTVCYIHQNAGYKHYIVWLHQVTTVSSVTTTYNKFYWFDEPTSVVDFTASDFQNATASTTPVHKLDDAFTNMEIYDVKSIGHALVILTSDGMYYYIWKGSDGYKKLGNHMPEPQLSFGLQGEADKTQETFQFTVPEEASQAEYVANGSMSPPAYACVYKTSKYKKAVASGVMADVNAFIAQKSVEAGKFIFPFMVRYAYRLFDETIVMQSCPVLMITDTFCSPHVSLQGMRGSTGWETLTGLIGCMLYTLDYRAILPDGYSTFSDYIGEWKDIIKSVDIFISEPIYTYDQSGDILGYEEKTPAERGYGVFNIPNGNKVYHTGTIKTQPYSKYYTSSLIFPTSGENVEREFVMPRYTDEEISQKMRDVHNFYLFKSIPISDINTDTRTVLPLPGNYLSGLTGRELMADDYYSHDTLIARYAFAYNQRLTVGNISRKLNNPFRTDAMVCYSYRSMASITEEEPVSLAYWTVYIFLNVDNKEIVIENTVSQLGYHNPFMYLYYPDPNAYKAVVERYTTSGSPSRVYYEIPLTRHDFLNGSVYFGGWNPSQSIVSTPQETSNNIVDMPNKLYTSELDNPYLFSKDGIQTVGIGSILGIRPAVKAMSPSQYGQFKFYAFTTDGVYALEVSKTGYLDPPTIVTPDIVNGNGESITQIDGAVIFATNRGIMMVSGSESVCISEVLNSKHPFIPFAASAADDILPKLRNIVSESILASIQPIPFLDYVLDCRMVYDYTHQHILVFNPSQPYAYVYSLKSKLWGMIPSTMQLPVLDFPAATVMATDTINDQSVLALVDYSKEISAGDEASQVYQGLIITRPLKLDMPDVLKTIPTVIQRGMFEKGHVYGALYGSRDLLHWQLVWSSVNHYIRGMHGTPYKYFRLALICNLTAQESLFGCSVGVMPRDTNNLR